MKFVLTFLAFLLLFACNKADEEEPITFLSDELIVGLSYGECAGDCAFLYLLKDDMAFEDQNIGSVAIEPENLTFSTTPIPNITQERIDSLFSQLPERLDDYETEDFGCPDCGDWGSLHVIRITDSGDYQAYVLDNATENMTASLQPYGRLIQRSLLDFRQ